MTLTRIAAAFFGLALTLAFAQAKVAVPPRPTQWVTDSAGALSQSTAASINAELQAYQNATHHRVIVWIGTTTGDDQLEDWTSTVAEAWGIGRKQQSDGAVLFLFMQDHRVRIEVGYGLEPTLTDAKSSLIVNQIILPKMHAGDVDGAVQGGVDGMLTAITPLYAAQIGHTVVPVQQQQERGGGNIDGLTIAFLIFLLFGIGWFVVVALINGIRYVWTLLTKGPEAAAKVWHNVWITSKGSANGGSLWPLLLLGSMGGGGGGFGGGGGGFSGGGFGGGFGGGGASGGW